MEDRLKRRRRIRFGIGAPPFRLAPLQSGLALLLAALLLLIAAAASAQDPVAVPGGPESIRRLLRLDTAGGASEFFEEVNEALLSENQSESDWSNVEARRRVMDFASDLKQWRVRFGNPATFTSAPGAPWERCRSALEWLGYDVRGAGPVFSAERRADPHSVRRQSFLETAGVSAREFLQKLREGQEAVIAIPDGTAPLPFGLAAWRETAGQPELDAGDAFLFFVQNVPASRMLVALDRMDPQTRQALRRLPDLEGPAKDGWRILYAHDAQAFWSYPEALLLRGGRFVLPGGAPADPLWTDLFRVAPTQPARFLEVFYAKDGGKAASFVDTLERLPDSTVEEILFGGAGKEASVPRFRSLYASIGSAAPAARDPYDFAHLAPWIESPDHRGIPGSYPEIAASAFPRNEQELASRLSPSDVPASDPLEGLLGVLKTETPAGAPRFEPQRRFLAVSALATDRTALAEPGVVLLLELGFDRLGAAFGVLEDPPFLRAALVRRYLFTLDRLDRLAPSRDTEVRAGLFQAYVLLICEAARSGSLPAAEAGRLLASLMDVPLFAAEDVAPSRGEAALFAWLATRLLPALPDAGASEGSDSDDRLERALVGPRAPVRFSWRGGRYRYVSAEDETARRRAFRQTQRSTHLSDLETFHADRDALSAALGRGDADAVRAAAGELAESLGLASEASLPEAEDERVERENRTARRALAEISSDAAGRPAPHAEQLLEAVDTALAERHLEAALLHIYAGAARDPEDLYFQDPFFVSRHSFRTVEKAGRRVQTAFTPTVLVEGRRGAGTRIAGSLFELTDVLGTLHADQLAYAPGAGASNEAIRSGLVAPIWHVDPSRLDDDAMEAVGASCRATVELARVLAARSVEERSTFWIRVGRGLVPRWRLAEVASLEDPGEAAIARLLSPSDLYRIGRRLAQADLPEVARVPGAERAQAAIAHLAMRHGEIGARQCLAEFGPQAAAYAGRYGLADIEMPAYERLAGYRLPTFLADRLYDLKIAVACRLAQAGLPAAVLPLVLPRALDVMLVSLKMAYPYDWKASTRAAAAFSSAELEQALNEAVLTGRLEYDGEAPARSASGP